MATTKSTRRQTAPQGASVTNARESAEREAGKPDGGRMGPIDRPALEDWGRDYHHNRTPVPAFHVAQIACSLYGLRTIADVLIANDERTSAETGHRDPIFNDNQASGLRYALAGLIDHVEESIEKIKEIVEASDCAGAEA